MRQKLFLMVLAFSAAISVNADPNGQPVPLTPVIVNPDNGNGGHPRSPIDVPVLYIDGYTLTAGDYTLGTTIRLIDENDNVVFSTYVAIEGDIQLPTTLNGTYTIEVISGDITFAGEIEL